MQKAFYFMPDISGFSEFVNTTEIEHSIHIISELLEILLDNNPIDFELVELEGDALFMFTTKQLQFEDILGQVHKMMIAFHTHTTMYEHKRICNCGSCRTTNNLELKFIIHYGNLNFIKVKDIIKPYGKDVIKTHRLLKNDVPLQEYLLISSSVYDLYRNQLDSSWKNLKQIYDQQEVKYFYTNLSHVKSDVKIEKDQLENEIQTLPIQSIQKIINADIEITYSLISELKYRHIWDEDVKRIDFDANKLNRIGTQHNCVLQFGSLNFETISEKSNESLVFGEKTKDMMFAKDFHYVLRLDKINETKTNLRLDLFLEFTTIGIIMKSTIIKRLTNLWNKKLEKLNQVASKQPIKN
jgi:hypothetical protein